METLALIQLLSQLLPTLINILTHYEELAVNGSEQDKEKMKIYLDSLPWKDWSQLKKALQSYAIIIQQLLDLAIQLKLVK